MVTLVRPSPHRSAPLLLLIVLIGTLSACSAAAPPAPTPLASLTTPTVASDRTTRAPLPSTAEPTEPATAEADLAFVEIAFETLLDRYYQPLDSAALLNSARDGVMEALRSVAGANTALPQPQFRGERTADWRAFSAFFVAAKRELASVNGRPLTYVAVRSMVKSLNDCFTRLDLPELAGGSQASYSGIGLYLSADHTVFEVFEGAPAAQAGIQAGDEIIAIDGDDVSALDREEILVRIRGPVETQVAVTVRRPSAQQPITVQVTRKTVGRTPVTSRLLTDGVGYLRVRTFADEAAGRQAVDALAQLRSQGARAFVLDLRHNDGGRVSGFIPLISKFIERGELFVDVVREGERRVISVDGSYQGAPGPLVVLVDGGTSGKGEVVAELIRRRGVGRVVGVPTAGCMRSGADWVLLPDGARLWLSVSSVLIDGQMVERVVPDVLVERTPSGELAGPDDVQLQQALTLLKS